MATKQIQSIALDPTDNRKYIITLNDKIVKGESAKLNYTKGDVAAADTGLLQNIINFIIANNATVTIPHLVSATTNTAGTQVILTFDTSMADVSGKQGEFWVKVESAIDNTYQKWNGYPDTPDLSSTYPYQAITNISGTIYLLEVTSDKLYMYNGNLKTAGSIYYRTFNGSAWGTRTLAGTTFSVGSLLQANNDIYTDSTLTTIHFAKTTSTTTTTNLAISSSALDTNDNKKIILSINVDSGYQKWIGYPDSPLLSSTYGYQAIVKNSAWNRDELLMQNSSFYHTTNGNSIDGSFRRYYLNNGAWTLAQSGASTVPITSVLLANNNIYDSVNHATLYFAKNTEPTSNAITNGQTVKASYTKGTVKSADGGSLESFVDVNVVNGVASPYQKWSGYPDSPVKTSDYPYQVIYTLSGYSILNASQQKLSSYNYNTLEVKPNSISYYIPSGNWASWDVLKTTSQLITFTGSPNIASKVIETNNDIYTNATFTAVLIAKTTP